MSGITIDPARLEEEWQADQEVLASLAENGDRAEIVRPVDVSFRGNDEALERVTEYASDLGFEFIEIEESDDGEPYLFLVRDQNVEADSIKALTKICLQIEAEFGVEYDGWGCGAEDGMTE